MALKERIVEIDGFPPLGNVSSEDWLEQDALAEAVKNLAKYDKPVYVRDLDDRLDGKGARGPVLSYTQALKNVYNYMQFLKSTTTVKENDKPEIKEVKEREAALMDTALKDIEPLIGNFAKIEYPWSEVTFKGATRDKAACVLIDTRRDPVVLNSNGFTHSALRKAINDIVKVTKYMTDNAPDFQTKRVDALKEWNQNLMDKMGGKDIRQKIKTDEEVLEYCQQRCAWLLRDDSQDDYKVDRARAENDLSSELARHGLELIRVPVEENISPEAKAENQVKSCVLRAAWDGYIERPKTDTLSPALKEVLHKGLERINPRNYNLDESPVWQICAQVPEFKKFSFELTEGLGKQGFPPEHIKDLSYSDIAYIINVEKQPTAEQQMYYQYKGVKRVDGVKFSSNRIKNVKKFTQDHEGDLRLMLDLHGTMSKTDINNVIEEMKNGHSNILAGHHNYTISNPEYFEKETKKSFLDMNNNVITVDKNVHTLIHMLENNVDRMGRIGRADTSSCRTIFADKKSGKKFYYAIRAKEGIEAILGFNHEVIYNKKYLSDKAVELKIAKIRDHSTKLKNKNENKKGVDTLRAKKTLAQNKGPINNKNPKSGDQLLYG